MNRKNSRPRFDVDALRDLVGSKVFSRGEAYWHDGLVELLTIGPKRVVAQVAGTEDYRVELLGSDPEAESLDVFAGIRRYLNGKDILSLVEMIMDCAERDPILFRRLERATIATVGDEATLEARLGKMIDGATATNGFVDYSEAADWARGVDEALDTVAALSSKHAGIAMALAMRAIDRIESAIDDMDDSDGHCGALLDRAGEIHRTAARAAPRDPLSLSRDLFAREMKGGYDTFAGAAGLYGDILGKDGLAEYRRLAAEAWDGLPATSGKVRQADHFRLMEILDFFAERDGDVETRIALRAKNLTS